MSAFFGCVTPSGSLEAGLKEMAAFTAGLPLQPLRIKTRQVFGLGCQPLWPQSDGIESALNGGLICGGAIRLDNRRELRSALGLTGAESLPDTALVIAAYQKWGWNCASRLRGDWSFALWDADAEELLLARDATGISGLYWWSDEGVMVFGNHLGSVLAHPKVPHRPDELQVACFLLGFDDPEVDDHTFFDGVRALLPGTVLRFNGRTVTQHRWWNPDGPELRFRSEQECCEAFLSLYRTAVVDALDMPGNQRSGIALSSGLDSCSVMALAAPEMAKSGHALKGYVHRPDLQSADFGHGLMHDEFDLAADAARSVGGVEVVDVARGDTSLLDGLALSQATHAQPSSGAGNFHWVDHVLDLAKIHGLGVLLTGQGGNGTVSWGGTGDLWPMLRRGRWLQAMAQLRSSRLPLPRALRLQLFSPVSQKVRLWQRGLKRSSFTWSAHSVIHPDLARRMDMQERMRAARHDVALSFPFSPEQIRLWRRDVSPGGQVASRWLEMGNSHAISVRDPTRDQRIVEFCWRLPDKYFWGDGSQRMLIRQGFAGLLPSSILRNPRRGVQSADLIARARTELPRIFKLIDKLESLQSGWIDVKLLRKCTEDLQQNDSFSTYRVLSGQVVPALSVALFAEKIADNSFGGIGNEPHSTRQ